MISIKKFQFDPGLRVAEFFGTFFFSKAKIEENKKNIPFKKIRSPKSKFVFSKSMNISNLRTEKKKF